MSQGSQVSMWEQKAHADPVWDSATAVCGDPTCVSHMYTALDPRPHKTVMGERDLLGRGLHGLAAHCGETASSASNHSRALREVQGCSPQSQNMLSIGNGAACSCLYLDWITCDFGLLGQ